MKVVREATKEELLEFMKQGCLMTCNPTPEQKKQLLQAKDREEVFQIYQQILQGSHIAAPKSLTPSERQPCRFRR